MNHGLVSVPRASAGSGQTINRYARRENFDHPIRTPLLREHFVYRCFNADGELLYVGCSRNWEKRLAEHKATSAPWYPLMESARIEGPYNYETARQVEYVAIESERSLFNYSRERRAIARIRSNLVYALIDRFLARDMAYSLAVTEASDIADELVPIDNRSPARIDDLTVASLQRDVDDYLAAMDGAR